VTVLRSASRVDAIEDAQRSSLDELRNDEDARRVFTELTQASCLLELAKLSTGKLDLGTWARSVVETIPQFFPIDTCRIELKAEGLPPTTAAYGSTDLSDSECFALGSGTLVVGPAAACTGNPFFTLAAEQLRAQVESVIDAERLRRRAAAAEALAVAATLEDLREVESLERLATALAALPSAIGASVSIQHRLVGGHVVARAGQPGTSRGFRFDLVGGEVNIDVAFATAPSDEDERSLHDVLDVVVTAIQRAEEQLKLREQAETDPLTGCGNRRVAARALAVAASRSRTIDEPLAVLSFDLDHFKLVNDDLGHPTGDAVLQGFAAGLREAVREWDVVCRMGGEEFLVICPDTDRHAALGLAERVLEGTPRWCRASLPEDRHQTVSAGIATFPDPADTIDKLLRGADAALYEAKAAGRCRAAFYEG
jgi:diguanylate cyclase (GGDEF)-like protein